MTEPPLARWPLTEITGEIRSQAGGKPVLCMQGSLQLVPAALYEVGPDERSWIELRQGGDLRFGIYFEDGQRRDLVSNGRHQTSLGPLSDNPGASLRSSGSWNWPDRSLEARVVATSADERDLSDEARFELRGTFNSPTGVGGEWTFESRTERGQCWSRSAGRGTWFAAPRKAEPPTE